VFDGAYRLADKIRVTLENSQLEGVEFLIQKWRSQHCV